MIYYERSTLLEKGKILKGNRYYYPSDVDDNNKRIIMSILHQNEAGWILSHSKFIEKVYENTIFESKPFSYKYKDNLFNINSVYLKQNQNDKGNSIIRSSKRKRNSTDNENLSRDVHIVKQLYEKLIKSSSIFNNKSTVENNNQALETADMCYKFSITSDFLNTVGGNTDNYPIKIKLFDKNFIFPVNCNFFCKDIKDMLNWSKKYIESNEKFELILLDPPWWNKYIRRKNSKDLESSYKMLSNENLTSIPIKNLLSTNGLVLVWCTNSKIHFNAVVEEFFPKWNVKFVTRYFWLKVTKYGEPICTFSPPSGKQPFELIIIGCHNDCEKEFNSEEKLVISVPCALHSNKPPLMEIFQDYLNSNPNCLEIFARYLLPNWTSWGLEVCRFQHECLFEENKK